MKVIGICCSPRNEGNTEILVREALGKAEELGAETELITVAGKNIMPCDGCQSCLNTGICHLKDDMQDIYPKLLEANGLIFGTPVYFWTVSGQAKVFIDRTHALREGRQLRNKIAGVIVVAGRNGTTDAFSVFQNFFTLQRMISTTGALTHGAEENILPEQRGGGAIAYAGGKGDVSNDERGIAESRALGEAIVKTVQLYQESGLI